MIYRLEFENFFSLRDAQVLDLTVAPNVPDPDGRFAPIFAGSPLRVPKVVALYGANASGKTNVLRALDFIFNLARSSAQRTAPGFACERFNDQESCSRPMRLAIELGGVMDLSQATVARMEAGEAVEQGTYRYETWIHVQDGTPTHIAKEELRQRPNGQGKWQRVFERDGQNNVKGSKTFSLSGFQHLLNTLQPNVSVLSSFALFQHPTAKVFVERMQRVMFHFGLHQEVVDPQVISYLAQQPEVLAKLNRELGRIDVGVEEMRFIDTANGPLAMFRHSGLGVEMPWILESHGTRAFIRMFPMIAGTLQHGGLAVIDEFDQAIHPLILPEIAQWFYGVSGRNEHDAQLWFSCHSASLLDDLKKEEIVICEKDRRGRTSVRSLMDVKVRRDDNHYRKYLSGVYGGVPQIG